jgi:hypothetical protein
MKRWQLIATGIATALASGYDDWLGITSWPFVLRFAIAFGLGVVVFWTARKISLAYAREKGSR